MDHERRGRRTDGVQVGVIAVAAFVVFGVAACSSSTGNAANRSATAPVVATAQNAAFGTILESGGRTLYTLVPSSTACDSACTAIWPELVLPSGAAMATAGGGVHASDLGTVNRTGGARQVTYSGKALYFFSQDAPGQVNGNITDVWGKWSVVVIASPAGAVAPAPTTTPTTSAPAAPPSTAGVPASTSPPAPTTTAPPAPPPPPPTTTTTAPGGGGGVGF